VKKNELFENSDKVGLGLATLKRYCYKSIRDVSWKMFFWKCTET